MAKRKEKIDLRQLLTDADKLLIPRAMLVKNYGLKNKASLRSMLSIARNKYPGKKPGDNRPKELTSIQRGILGMPDWLRVEKEKVKFPPDPDPFGFRQNAPQNQHYNYGRVEAHYLSEESTKMRQGGKTEEEKRPLLWGDTDIAIIK